MRSGGSGVVVKSRNSSGCLIVRKKGDGLGATASTSRKLYESKKRPNINVPVSSSDSGSSDELLMPPGRRLGPETIRVCNGLVASERVGSEISRKRDRVERISGSGEDIVATYPSAGGRRVTRGMRVSTKGIRAESPPTFI